MSKKGMARMQNNFFATILQPKNRGVIAVHRRFSGLWYGRIFENYSGFLFKILNQKAMPIIARKRVPPKSKKIKKCNVAT
ncbi:MAG: hypothetical protein Q4F57_08395 [Weeksellaceae bacterium]|nr:hypothetical protein [Weeksellaceae bacterium]